jgi:hypothetical protein
LLELQILLVPEAAPVPRYHRLTPPRFDQRQSAVMK